MVYLRLRERLRKALENEAKNLTPKVQASEQLVSTATARFAGNSKVSDVGDEPGNKASNNRLGLGREDNSQFVIDV